jgi:hypothetical protein
LEVVGRLGMVGAMKGLLIALKRAMLSPAAMCHNHARRASNPEPWAESIVVLPMAQVGSKCPKAVTQSASNQHR